MFMPRPVCWLASVLALTAWTALCPAEASVEPDVGDCVSALQLDRGPLQRPAQAQRSPDSLQRPAGLAQGGALGAAGSAVEDFEDYRADALAFLKQQPEVSCDLPRVSLEEANRAFDELVQEFAQEGAQPPDWRPWVTREPRQSEARSPVEKARYFLAMRLFGGPGIVEGVTSSWPAMSRWEASSMKSRLGEHRIRPGHFDYPEYVHMVHTEDFWKGVTLAEYLESGMGGKGYFLFVNEAEEPHDGSEQTLEELRTVELLREDFMPHPKFSTAPEERHAILAIDGMGSSHGLHVHGPVWQTQVTGRKAWWLLPPEIPGDLASEPHSTEFLGKDADLRNDHGSAPIVDGVVYKAPNACAYLKRTTAPPGSRLCVAGPGDTVLLPEDTWHGTCALDLHTVSVGGWMVDRRFTREP